MKAAATLILVFSTLFAYAQEGRGTNLNIFAGDCRIENILLSIQTQFGYLEVILSFKMPPVPIGRKTRDPIVIKNLQPGGYQS